MANSFVGYSGYLVERLGLISRNFMSTGGGVSSNIFAADNTVSQGQRRESLQQLFGPFGLDILPPGLDHACH